MGQYYIAVNLDKKEYISPYHFGGDTKLFELGANGFSTMMALSILLADDGQSDMYTESPVIGSWAGDQIVIAGDYARDGKIWDSACSPGISLHEHALASYKNISDDVLLVMAKEASRQEKVLDYLRIALGARFFLAEKGGLPIPPEIDAILRPK